jgi:ketosteroid isomerase-like protein
MGRTVEPRLIHHLFRIIDDAEWDLLGEVFTPDSVYHRPGFAPMHGLGEIEHFYRHVRSISGCHCLHAVLTARSSASCWGRFQGSRSDAGDPVDVLFADWYVFRGRSIAERRTFFFEPSV